MKHRTLSISLILAMAAVGCDKDKTIQSYDAPKDTQSAPPAVAANDVEPSVASADIGFPADLRWTLPSGWTQVPVPPGGMFRADAAIRVSESDPRVLLTVTHLGDAPGARSIVDNVNRWAGQLQLPRMSEEDLPKVVTHLSNGDVQADVAELDGAGKKTLGAIIPHAAETWFIKLSGPAEVVTAEKERFSQFMHSIHFDASPAPAPSAPAPSSDAGNLSTGAGGAQWVLPAGWTAEQGGPMRLATIHPEGNGGAEIKVSKFAGLGGGAGANVSRWRADVGLDAVDDAHADAGQQLTLNGRNWTVHDYSGPQKRVIIAMTDAGGETWFFKLVGPIDAVGKLKPSFDQFLGSVRIGP